MQIMNLRLSGFIYLGRVRKKNRLLLANLCFQGEKPTVVPNTAVLFFLG